MTASNEEVRAKVAETRRMKEEAAAQKDAETRAEIEAQAQAVEDKTARLRSLRLAREAGSDITEPKPVATKRKKKR